MATRSASTTWDETELAQAIAASLPLRPAPCAPDILLHLAGDGADVRPVVQAGPKAWRDVAPYFAYQWAGGAALARWRLDHRDEIAGREVIDLGSGSGLVAIAAMIAGARSATAFEIDPRGAIAIALNAAANRVAVRVEARDPLDEERAQADIVLAGDVFYEPALARRALSFLARCSAAGARVLIGDPGRKPLPVQELVEIARYRVRDFGDASDCEAGVFELRA